MDKEIINKVLELAAYKKQLESLREVLLKLRFALSKMEIELGAEFEKL